MLPSASQIGTSNAKRLVAAFAAGCVLSSSLYTPQASAIVPAGVWAAMAVRGVVSGVARSAAIPAASSASAQLSAAGLFGVSAAAFIVLCGSNYVSGNDCSGTPLAKLRSKDQTGSHGETAASTVPATGGSSYAATSASGICHSGGTCKPTLGELFDAVGPEACASQGKVYGAAVGGSVNCISNVTWPESPMRFQHYNGVTGWTYFTYGTKASATYYTCPSGGTLSGTTCTIAPTTCPAGYTLTGGNCVPPAGLWQSDGVPSYRNTGGAWTADPLDPDPVTFPLPTPYQDMIRNSQGKKFIYRITAESDGSTRVETWDEGQTVSTTPQTVTTYNQVRIGPDGKPTATTQLYYGDPETVAAQTPPSTQTPYQGDPGSQLELPTDYARENTLQQTRDETKRAADELKKLNDDGLKIKEDGTPTGANPATESLIGRIGRGGAGGGDTGSVYPDDDNIGSLIAPSSELQNKRAATDTKVGSAFNMAESCSAWTIGQLTLDPCGAPADWLRLALAWVYGLGGVVYLYRRSGDVLTGSH